MLRIAGQTAGPIGLNFFVDTQGWTGGCFDAIAEFASSRTNQEPSNNK